MTILYDKGKILLSCKWRQRKKNHERCILCWTSKTCSLRIELFQNILANVAKLKSIPPNPLQPSLLQQEACIIYLDFHTETETFKENQKKKAIVNLNIRYCNELEKKQQDSYQLLQSQQHQPRNTGSHHQFQAARPGKGQHAKWESY